MINIGNTELNIKLGNEDIPAIYIGDTLIYPTTVTAWTVEPSSLSIPYDGEIARIKLAALTAWTATTDVNWITLSESTGDGGRYNIDVTVSPNISTVRTANVVITGEDSHTETISISQAALPFSASVDSISAYNEGGTFVFDIMCPHSWTIVVSGDSTNWLTVSPLTGTNGTVQVGVVISQLEGDEGRDVDLVITDDVTGDELVIPVQQTPTPPYETLPLTFEILSAGTITWKAKDGSLVKTISYSKDNGSNWTDITSTTAGTSFNVAAGDKVLFKGENPSYATNANNYNSFSGSTAVYNVYGNIMSLVGGDNFSGLTTLEQSFNFYALFLTTKVNDASNLVLPATTLKISCYQNMFSNCTSLTQAPELPATTLASNCYQYMFVTCTSLTTPPSILPATTLGVYCYYGMFQNCTSLTSAPELPTTTLTGYCYYSMFQGCTGLTSAPELPATTLANNCYSYMFYGCTSLTSAPELPATTLDGNCYNSMFRDCTSLTSAPELPATTLAGSCYSGMFRGCTSLTTAPELPATTLAAGCYGAMFRKCTSLNYIKCLATDISASSCTSVWVDNVSSTGTFVKNPSMSSWTTGTSGIPANWTVQDAS